jgi:hypothetical protein
MKKTRIGALNLFFQNIRQNGWDNTLPGTAAFYLGDIPRFLNGSAAASPSTSLPRSRRPPTWTAGPAPPGG